MLNKTGNTINLFDLLTEIWKKFYIVVIAMIITGVLSYSFSAFALTPKYKSAVNLIVNTTSTSTDYVSNDNITSAKNLVATYSVVIKSNTVLNQVIDNLNLDMTYNDLSNAMTVQAVNNTQIMEVSVLHPDPQVAKAIVDQITQIAPDIIVEAVEAGSCKVISQVTVSVKPVTPNIPQNVLFAMVIGVFIAVVVIIVRMLTKQTNIIDDQDVQKYLDLPVLGIIPEVGEVGKNEKRK